MALASPLRRMYFLAHPSTCPSRTEFTFNIDLLHDFDLLPNKLTFFSLISQRFHDYRGLKMTIIYSLVTSVTY